MQGVHSRLPVLLCVLMASSGAVVHAAPLQIMHAFPVRNAVATPVTPVIIDFDKPVAPGSVNASTFRVFGRASGAKSGTFTISNGGRRVTFVASEPYSAGETVRVNLSHDLGATDLTTLRAAGYFFQFVVRTVPSGSFQPIGELSNRTGNAQTRIYGAAATDLNNDGYADLATINEVSADVRVFLNRADGSALYQPFLTPQAIGVESSPNDPADFDNDGNTDLCVAASSSNSISVLLGAGTGSFSTRQEVPVGAEPHAITTLDVDGDGDADIVNANFGSNQLALLVNNGAGVFAPATFFEGGVNGEYGLVAADMNNDGIADLVVGGNSDQTIRVLLGNGDGTFTPAGPAQPCGGQVWVIVVDDVNGDGNLDASVANSFSANAAILLGNGAGAFGAPVAIATGFHTPSTDLGDMDGDGDPDLVLSVFDGGFWRYYRNNGAGVFTFKEEFTAPNNPSCAVLFDADNDGDLDMALTDEIADKIVLMRNLAVTTAVPSAAAPDFTVLPNSPNPFGRDTRIRFSLPHAAAVRLEVYDTAGRRVAGTGPLQLSAGAQTLRYDGRDALGKPLVSGVYAYRILSDGLIGAGRMVVTR